MRKNYKTKIYAIIGAAALSCSAAPINPSVITTHAAANTPVTESSQENTVPSDTPGIPDSSEASPDNTLGDNSVNPSEVPTDSSEAPPNNTPDENSVKPSEVPTDSSEAPPNNTPGENSVKPSEVPSASSDRPSETPDTPSASPSEAPGNIDSIPGEASSTPDQSSTEAPDSDGFTSAEPTTAPDVVPTEAPDASPSAENPEESNSSQPDVPDGNDAVPSETPIVPDIVPTNSPEDSENAESADKMEPEGISSAYSLDQQNPVISYERIEKEDGQYAHITVTDPGDNASGIKECQITVDGENHDLSAAAVQTSPLQDGQDAIVMQEYEIPLEGDVLHEIQVQATDNAGNVASELISMRAVNDVIEVILPASFNITIWPFDENGRQIYSDDVVICNQSNFPVDVSITDVSLAIDHSLPDDFQDADGISKDCSVSLQLRQMNLEPVNYLLNEGSNGNIANFSLSAKQEETDPQQLLQMQPVDTISSPDFAVFNLFGNVSPGSELVWQNGDLKVKVTFEFYRQP